MFMTSTILSDTGPASVKWIVDNEIAGLASGRIGVLLVPADGTATLAPADGHEQTAYVLAGTGQAAHQGASSAIGPDHCLFVPRGRSLAVRATRPLGLLIVETRLPAGGRREPARARVVNAADIAVAPYHNPALGFLHVAARWLIDDALAGSEATVVGQSQFAPGSAHLFHRHARAEEFFCVLEGNGVHLVDGGEVAMGPGDIVVVPRNEWHGFRNTGATLVRAAFGYIGTNSVEAGGYEVQIT